MSPDQAAGVRSLVAMAVIATMRKLGATSVHITREDLSKAAEVHAEVSQGVFDGMRVRLPNESAPGPGTPSGKPHFEPVYQCRPGHDAGWQDCTEQRYHLIGQLIEHQAEAGKPPHQNWTWDRRTLYRRIEPEHCQD